MDDKNIKTIRADYKLILGWVDSNSRVLDLGCGDGDLLALLKQEKGIRGTGIEINEDSIYRCVEKGLSVHHGDIDSGLFDYTSNQFDYVILNESLQEVLYLEKVILESLRVGKKVIVGVPNFCNIRARFQILFQGRVPVTKELPHQWYDTPNLRFLSLKDFKCFCQEKDIIIEDQKGIFQNKDISFLPNLFANIGLFLLRRD